MADQVLTEREEREALRGLAVYVSLGLFAAAVWQLSRPTRGVGIALFDAYALLLGLGLGIRSFPLGPRFFLAALGTQAICMLAAGMERRAILGPDAAEMFVYLFAYVLAGGLAALLFWIVTGLSWQFYLPERSPETSKPWQFSLSRLYQYTLVGAATFLVLKIPSEDRRLLDVAALYLASLATAFVALRPRLLPTPLWWQLVTFPCVALLAASLRPGRADWPFALAVVGSATILRLWGVRLRIRTGWLDRWSLEDESPKPPDAKDGQSGSTDRQS